MSTKQQQQNGQPDLEYKRKKPSLFKVLIHNDDFTPMDFVTYILVKFFKKTEQEAQKIMLEVHHNGSGIAGVYTKEIAETKVQKTNQYARNHDYPLKTTMEKE